MTKEQCIDNYLRFIICNSTVINDINDPFTLYHDTHVIYYHPYVLFNKSVHSFDSYLVRPNDFGIKHLLNDMGLLPKFGVIERIKRYFFRRYRKDFLAIWTSNNQVFLKRTIDEAKKMYRELY